MLRRCSKHNDYRDYVMARPSRVVDEIYEIRYFVQGYSTEIACGFVNNGEILSVTIPSQMLALLPNGILMRRCKYRVEDSSYPDGYYDLVFEDSLDVWLGDYDGDGPQDYVTEDELASTLSSYATQEWVSGQCYLTADTLPSDIATEEWVESQGYLTSETIPSDIATESYVQSALYGFATESWVESQGYLTEHQDLTGYATQSWVESQCYLTEHQDLTGYATQSWVESQGYLTSTGLSGLATQSWVSSNFLSSDSLEGYATQSWVSSQGFITVGELPSGLATQSWVESQGYVTQYWVSSQGYLTSVPSEYATQAWVSSQGYYVEDGDDPVATQGYVDQAINDAIFGSDVPMPDLSSYATMSWVEEQGYVIEDSEDPFATESWVQSQGYLTSHQDLTGYATQSWVQSQGYLTAVPSEYATESWVSQNYFEESKIWCGTQEQWNRLTSEEKATYKIALVTA